MSNSLDPDQARRFVEPDLGPNCLPRLSADDTGRQRVNANNKQEFEQPYQHLVKQYVRNMGPALVYNYKPLW